MNRQTLHAGVVGLVAGGLGALFVGTLSTPANARGGGAPPSPHIVQFEALPGPQGGSFVTLVYRLWSDGTMDLLHVQELGVCAQNLPTFCYRGQIPTDFYERADLNFDGKVDGADLGKLLAEWSQQPPAAE